MMESFVDALIKEIELQKNYFQPQTHLESIYLGGGTPSLLSAKDLDRIFTALHRHFNILPEAEITLEANPDDLTKELLSHWKNIGINRLSLGLQSVIQKDLSFMHRVHNAQQSLAAVDLIRGSGFELFTLDFIYGIPLTGVQGWLKNLDFLKTASPPHFSAYALTVEPRTRLYKDIQKGKNPAPDEQEITEQFLILQEFSMQNGYDAYEISNYARPGYRAIHNSSYWYQKPYLGLGPAAHSFSHKIRKANSADIKSYIANLLEKQQLPEAEIEELTIQNQTNEWIMTRLRLAEGISIQEYLEISGHSLESRTKDILNKFITLGYLTKSTSHYKLTSNGKLHADGIAAELFWE
jgi:oxygen-independent coproporphyrinogen-3 oxidase